MGKQEEFDNILNRMIDLVDDGKIDGDSMKIAYLGLCANYLSCIADELHKMNEREAEKK